MKDQRVAILVLDSYGQWTKRFGVSRRIAEGVACGLGLAVLLGLFMTLHGLLCLDTARESDVLTQENKELHELLATIEAKLPVLQEMETQTEVGFVQLWSKSGLGVETWLVGLGPFENDDSHTLPGTGRSLGTAFSGEILSVEPVALPLETERLEHDGEAVLRNLSGLLEYFHDAEGLLSHTPSVRPTQSRYVTSHFGRRLDPIHKIWMWHKGIDIGGKIGMPIFAPSDGEVIYAGRRGGYGITVVLHHGFGIQTHFAHLSQIKVQVGQRVKRGDLIAEMGSTGKSTGPHLHYEVRQGGRPLDPYRFILD